MKGLSDKEMNMVSFLELNEKLFFTKDDVKHFFKDDNDMSVYIHKLKKKGRIIKINKTKYYLIPIRAFQGHWSEHPFNIIDEIFNGKDYYIGGASSAHYWGLIEQIPAQIEVYCTRKQGRIRIFNFTIIFKRLRNLNTKDFVKQKTNKHAFFISTKKKAEKWLSSK